MVRVTISPQVFEQQILARLQVDALALACNLARGPVEHQVGDTQNQLLVAQGRAAKQGAHAGGELGEGERLDQIIVAAGIEASDALVDAIERGEEEDGHRDAGAAQDFDQAEAVHSRKHAVDNDQVVGRAGSQEQRVAAVRSAIDCEALGRKARGQVFPGLRLRQRRAPAGYSGARQPRHYIT